MLTHRNLLIFHDFILSAEYKQVSLNITNLIRLLHAADRKFH